MIAANIQKDEQTGFVRQASSEVPRGWTALMNVVVENSGESDTLGKRLTAIAYVLTERDGELQYYFSKNKNEMVTDGALNTSVTGTLCRII